MSDEENIKQELEVKFSFLKDAVTVKRKNRIFADVSLEKFAEVFDYAVKEMRFGALSTITGMDLGNGFAVLYHLNREGKIILTLKVNLGKDNPSVKTVTSLFPNADIYEREIMDLLGIEVSGLAPGGRYPLPDNWPKNDHPLRKNWKGDVSKGEVQNA